MGLWSFLFGNAACNTGAKFQHASSAYDGGGWRDMSTAPRDGTPIEVKCTYGVAPTYQLSYWSDERRVHESNGLTIERNTGECNWWSTDTKIGSTYSDEASLVWRPYEGDPKAYVDPTRGAQKDMAYWRGAVAASGGLPPDTFEAKAAANARRNAAARLGDAPHE